MTVLEIPDEVAEALKAKAMAAGLTLEAWLKQLAGGEEKPQTSRPLQQIANFIVESMNDVPPEILATMPTASMTITFTAGPSAKYDGRHTGA